MITFSSASTQFGRQLLFVEASFQLNPGEKVGLVGPNGSRNTTLFRMITGEEEPDEGEISVPKKLTIGYFRRDVDEMVEALRDFEGTMLFVSHGRAFLRGLSNGVLELGGASGHDTHPHL